MNTPVTYKHLIGILLWLGCLSLGLWAGDKTYTDIYNKGYAKGLGAGDCSLRIDTETTHLFYPTVKTIIN